MRKSQQKRRDQNIFLIVKSWAGQNLGRVMGEFRQAENKICICKREVIGNIFVESQSLQDVQKSRKAADPPPRYFFALVHTGNNRRMCSALVKSPFFCWPGRGGPRSGGWSEPSDSGKDKRKPTSSTVRISSRAPEVGRSKALRAISDETKWER
jgi:hypothetical protein